MTIGHYAPGDIEYMLVHDGTVLLELDDVSRDFSIPKAPGGTGLGRLKNRYHKVTGAPEGTFSMSRSELQSSEKGELFLRLAMGAAGIITEKIATASVTHTLSHTPVGIYEIRVGRDPFSFLEKNIDYTVNWVTNVITFTAALTGTAWVKYATADRDWFAPNLLVNGSFESDISGLYYAYGGTIARNDYVEAAASVYAGDYSLKVTTGSSHDGVLYSYPIAMVPNRRYLLRFWMIGAAGKSFGVNVWNNATKGTTYTLNTGSTSISAVAWTRHEYYITANDVEHDGILIRNNSVTPGGPFYIDQMSLREYAPVFDLMTTGLNTGFMFEIWAVRVVDGTVIYKLTGCEIYSLSFASGDKYTESIEGQFLGYIPQAEGIADVVA